MKYACIHPSNSNLHASLNRSLSSPSPPTTTMLVSVSEAAANHPLGAGVAASFDSARTLDHRLSLMSNTQASSSILPAPACPRALGSASPNTVTRLGFACSFKGSKVLTLLAPGPSTPSALKLIVSHSPLDRSKTSIEPPSSTFPSKPPILHSFPSAWQILVPPLSGPGASGNFVHVLCSTSKAQRSFSRPLAGHPAWMNSLDVPSVVAQW